MNTQEITMTNAQNITQDFNFDTHWLNYFNPIKAVASVFDHVRTLPSSQTPEQYTYKAYHTGLNDFAQFTDSFRMMPTPSVIKQYVASLLNDRKLSSRTVNSKYLAPLRHFLTALSEQHIQVTGHERDYVQDCKEQFRLSAKIKPPRKQTTSNLSPLWGQGKRLNMEQVNAIFRGISTSTITGKRDYALFYLAFNSAFRLAELQRISLSSFTIEGDMVLISVRGKRNNIDPVPVPYRAYELVLEYVNAYNAELAHDDPRRIDENGVIWRALSRSDNHLKDAIKGMSAQGLRRIISKRSGDILGKENALAPHDTRRTAAAIAFRRGMPINAIQKLLRHKDPAITLRYVGEEPDYGKILLNNYAPISA